MEPPSGRPAPGIISQEYLGTGHELAAAMRGGGLGLPGKTKHKEFGARRCGVEHAGKPGVSGIIDEIGRARPRQPLSTGTYLALAALNRLVAPCSKAGFADWWKTTATGRFTRSCAGDGSPPVLGRDARRDPRSAGGDQPRIAVKIVQSAGVDVSSVALDMTNFATFIDTASGKAPSHSAARPSRNAATCGW